MPPAYAPTEKQSVLVELPRISSERSLSLVLQACGGGHSSSTCLTHVTNDVQQFRSVWGNSEYGDMDMEAGDAQAHVLAISLALLWSNAPLQIAAQVD